MTEERFNALNRLFDVADPLEIASHHDGFYAHAVSAGPNELTDVAQLENEVPEGIDLGVRSPYAGRRT